MDDQDDDIPALSSTALAALQDFYSERDKDLEAFEELRSSSSHEAGIKAFSMSMFKEDWNASQFWFTDETANFLARQLLSGCTTATSIAIVSAPSVFILVKNLLLKGECHVPARLCLLEYDERFELLGDFVKYDFNRPTELPTNMQGAFDRILCDPPYHSKGCIGQYAKTVEWLAKEHGGGESEIGGMRIVCTGDTMKDEVERVFGGVSITRFRPQHTVRLDNRYACFADFNLSASQIQLKHEKPAGVLPVSSDMANTARQNGNVGLDETAKACFTKVLS